MNVKLSLTSYIPNAVLCSVRTACWLATIYLASGYTFVETV